jgi:hypothetical protein
LSAVPHHIGAFQVMKEIVKAVWRAVVSERKALAATQPHGPKGRASPKAAQQAARKQKRWDQQGADLFTPRHLLGKHHLSASERQRLWHITRGVPLWRKLRERMEQV